MCSDCTVFLYIFHTIDTELLYFERELRVWD
jgi:hypothetical protein